MREVPGRGQRAAGTRPRPLGRARLLAAIVLAALGLSAAAGAFVGLAAGVSRGVEPLREAGMPAAAQRFTFDRSAWRAVAIDDVFPPVYHSPAPAPPLLTMRHFTRIGVAAPADCRTAFDPDLARLLSAHRCGPVLRVDYTDATRTLVATVGVAILGTGPDDQLDVHAATAGHHDDLRPRAVAFPGTPAAAFGDAQRVAFHVVASANAPVVDFAAVGFSDGRPASADPGRDAVDQSGAESAAVELGDLAGARIELAFSELWSEQR